MKFWKKLQSQFQKKTWANKLELRCKLYTMRLQDGDSVHSSVKVMTEVFESLAMAEDPVSDEDLSCICLQVFLPITACL